MIVWDGFQLIGLFICIGTLVLLGILCFIRWIWTHFKK